MTAIKRARLKPPCGNNYIFLIKQTQRVAFRLRCVPYALQLSHPILKMRFTDRDYSFLFF